MTPTPRPGRLAPVTACGQSARLGWSGGPTRWVWGTRWLALRWWGGCGCDD